MKLFEGDKEPVRIRIAKGWSKPDMHFGIEIEIEAEEEYDKLLAAAKRFIDEEEKGT